MATVSVSLPSDGTTADVSDYNTPITTLVNEFNGNIDNANIKSGAAISGSKLADASVDLSTKSSSWDGWIYVSDSWSYASATTITVPSDATTKYSVGDRIKLVQSSSTKYFYITSVSATSLTVNGGTDYTVANSAISGIYYSKAASPLGFPQVFNYTPTFTNLSGGTLTSCTFSLVGKRVKLELKYTLAGANISGTVSFTLPITASSIYNEALRPIGQATYEDAGTATYMGYVSSLTTTTARFYANNAAGTYLLADSQLSSTAPHTWANTDIIRGRLEYDIP